MPLHAYLDASVDKHKSVCAVSGFLSADEDWIGFASDWAELLSAHQVSDFFHMTDFENRVGVYKDWSNPQRVEFLVKAVDIISRHATIGIGYGVDVKSFARTQTVKEQLRTPFSMCAQGILATVGSWVRREVGPVQIAYVFELGDEGAGHVREAFRSVESDPDRKDRFCLGSIGFESKKGAPQLQAADMVAYEMMKQFLRFAGHDTRPTRKLYLSFHEKLRFLGGFADAGGVEMFEDHLPRWLP